MGWPQITWLILAGLGMGLHMALHGKPRTGNHSLFLQIVATGITAGLLYAGGFFHPA